MNVLYIYTYFLFFILLLIIIFVLKRWINISSFNSKVITIKSSFKNSLRNSIKCAKNSCIINCLVQNVTNKKWKKYSEYDIPGPYPYNYSNIIMSHNICKANTVILISVVTSCNEIEERMAIRMIYKEKYANIQFHFFIGLSSNECQKMYNDEKIMFNDISQISIQESFANETLFTLYLHKVLPLLCPKAKYYGKMDADIYINYDRLLNILKINKEENNIMYVCKVWKLFTIDINQENKYSSPKIIKDYYNKVLPKEGIPCFTGSFTLWPKHLSKELYKESLNEKNIIRMDDQHISWLVYKLNRNNLNISYYNLKCVHVFNERSMLCKYPIKKVIAFHQLKGKLLYIFSQLAT